MADERNNNPTQNQHKELSGIHGVTAIGKRKCVNCGNIIYAGQHSVDMTSHIFNVYRTGDHCSICISLANKE